MILYLLWISVLSLSVGIVIEDFYDSRSNFSIGSFYFISEEAVGNYYNTVIQSCLASENTVSYVSRCNTLGGCNLFSLAGSASSEEFLLYVSQHLHYCSSSSNNEDKEFLLQESIAQYPWNEAAVKSLAFHYEWEGRVGATIDLYDSCSLLTVDIGCQIHSALANPPILWNDHQSRYFYLRTLSKLYSLLWQPMNARAVARLSLIELPLNVQYNGHNIVVVNELLSKVVVKQYPELMPDRLTLAHNTPKSVIRLGVVSESHSNSSPGLCIHKVLQRLFESQSNGNRTEIQLVFFDRPVLNTIFAETMRSLAVDTIVLKGSPDILDVSRSIIEAHVDILLYLALPTEKLTYFLAHLRLAPIQIQFGLGHPFSSGISTIDYSVVGRDMLPSSLAWPSQKNRTDAVVCGLYAHMCPDMQLNLSQIATLDVVCPHMPEQCMRNSFQYVEQRVLFDTLGYYTEDPVYMYSGDADVHQQLSIFANHRTVPNGIVPVLGCEYLNNKFREWGIHPNVTAEQVGCFTGEPDGLVVATTPSVRLYSAMHIVKKLHPWWDAALLGILSKDSGARIVGLGAMRHIFPRLVPQLKKYGLTITDLHDRVLLVDRLPHTEYLSLLGLSSVFLNPFPYGSGVSSSDALAMCVPVVVLPEKTEILHFALGQVKRFSSALLDIMVVHSVNDYIDRAVDIAQGSTVPLSTLRNTICQEKWKLFGEENLAAVTDEWKAFLLRISS